MKRSGFPIVFEDSNTIIAGSYVGSGRAILAADINFAEDTEFNDDANDFFVSNIANWLSATNPKVLLYTNDGYYTRGTSPGVLALNDLGVSHSAVYSTTYFNLSLYLYSWDLVVIDSGWIFITSILDDINNYLDTGGKLIMSYYDADSVAHPLWSRIGFEVADSPPISSYPTTYIWQSSHGIFNLPNDYTAGNFTPGISYGDQGDFLTVFSNATALAGFYETPASGNATIVLGLNGRVIYNALLINEYIDDLDDSTYPDHYELWENEIAYIPRPTINHPVDVEYEEGTTGHSITWTPLCDRPQREEVTVDAAHHSSSSWDGGPITISIDGLSVGLHEYEVRVFDTAGYSVSDTVNVNVTSAPTTPTTPPNGTGPPLDTTTLLIIIAAAGVVVIILIVILRKKK